LQRVVPEIAICATPPGATASSTTPSGRASAASVRTNPPSAARAAATASPGSLGWATLRFRTVVSCVRVRS